MFFLCNLISVNICHPCTGLRFVLWDGGCHVLAFAGVTLRRKFWTLGIAWTALQQQTRTRCRAVEVSRMMSSTECVTFAVRTKLLVWYWPLSGSPTCAASLSSNSTFTKDALQLAGWRCWRICFDFFCTPMHLSTWSSMKFHECKRTCTKTYKTNCRML
jgi:hypothetical protein